MTFMLCPICREKVLGGGVDELSQSLREHLSHHHCMTALGLGAGEEVLRPAYDAHDGNAMGTVIGTSSRPSERVPERQEVTDFLVRCPFCDQLVAGRSESDLGAMVGEHWSRDHGIHAGLRSHLPPIWGGRRTD
jgi:hypothetical protein